MKRLEMILIVWTLVYFCFALIWLVGYLTEGRMTTILMIWLSGLFNLCGANLYHKKASEWLQGKI